MIDLDALRAAIVGDKHAAALVAAGDHAGIADWLNAAAPGAAGIPASASVDVVAPLLVASELQTLPQRDFDVVRLLVGTPGDLSPDQLAGLAALFGANTTTGARLAALATRTPSRGELLGLTAPADIGFVGLVLAPRSAADALPPDPTPTRTYARFVVQKGLVTLPALAGGTLDPDTPFEIAADGIVDQAVPFKFRGTPGLPPQLLAGVTYYVAKPSGATFAVTDAPGGAPIPVDDGAGLITFPGYTLQQVAR